MAAEVMISYVITAPERKRKVTIAAIEYDDACRLGNPKETSVADITKLYESLVKEESKRKALAGNVCDDT